MNKFTLTLIASAFASILMGCGGEADSNESMLSPAPTASNTSTPAATCVPNEQKDCQCTDGAEGWQACAKDGKSYSACVCIAKPEAGTVPELDAGTGADAQNDAGNDAEADAKHECETDQDCAKFNTQCMFFGCLNFMCFETHDTCGLNVEATLAASTPAGMNVAKNATNTPVVKVNLAATYDAKINGLIFHRVGTGSTKDIAKVYLFDEYNKTTTAGKTFDPNTDTVQFDALDYTVPSGTTRAYSLYVDFAGDAISVTGGQHAFELQNVSSVWLSDAGHVTGSFPVRGNTFTVSSTSAGTLKAELAASPISGTTVKKTQNVEVLGIRLTAGANDMLVGAIPLKCQASIHGAPFSASDCWQRITSLAIFDGTQQLGYAMAPNTDGKVPVLVNHLIPNGSTKTLTVKASFASAASVDEPFDKVAVGLDMGAVATDTVYNQSVSVEVGANLSTQLSQSPTVFFTVLNSGTLTIASDTNAYPSVNVVGGVTGTYNWTPCARYVATGQYESARISRVNVFMPDYGYVSDDADMIQVGVAINGQLYGTNILPAGKNGNVDIDLSANPLMVPKDGKLGFDLVCQLAAPIPTSAGSGDGVPRSGHTPGLGLNWSKQAGEWDPNYANAMNVRASGEVSNEHMFAPAGAQPGNLMVLRKNLPTFTKKPLPTTVLQMGSNVAYTFQISATPYGTGNISIGQFAFEITTTPGVKYAPILYKNGTPANTYGYAYDNNATEPCYWGDGYYCWTGQHSFLFRFYQEDTVSSDSPATYKLVLEVYETPKTGSAITTGMVYQNALHTAKVIDLGCGVVQPTTFGLGLDKDGSSRPGIIWSDQSEVPHGFITSCMSSAWSSADWIGDFLIPGMDQSSTLSN